MRTLPPAYTEHLAGSTTTLAYLWKATLTNGTIVRATTHHDDVTYDGELYLSTIGYNASDIQSTADLTPDNMEVEGFLVSPAITDDDIQSGKWDYAAVEMFEINWADPTMGRRILRTGTLGEIKGGRNKFVAELRGCMQALSRTIVRLTSKECDADLGDARCKVNLAAYTVTGTVSSITNNRIIISSRPEAAEWFTGGKLTFTSGLNNGLSMEVKFSSPGVIQLFLPMYFAIVVGDSYSLSAGCTKRFDEDCGTKFNNKINFRGFPHLPGDKIYKTGGV